MKFKHLLSLTLVFALLFTSTASALVGKPIDLNSIDTDPQVTEEEAGALPSKLDLRDRGVVPPVKSQEPWGTCWSFGSIAASEISILSDLGLTYDEFREKYGYDMDLSERHLAWFGTGHMPNATEDDPNASAVEITQAGEGFHNVAEDSDPNTSHYEAGGFALHSSGIFAAGFGPELESDVPYTANDGTMSTDSDWSVSEDTRFVSAFDLLDSSIFPNPAVSDDDRTTYTYNEAATLAIKKELNNGHAVAIAYHGDISKPSELSIYSNNVHASLSQTTGDDDSHSALISKILALGYSEEDAQAVVSFVSTGSTEGMDEETKDVVTTICVTLVYGEEAESIFEMISSGEVTEDDVLSEIASQLFNTDPDINPLTGEKQYINLETYAQYTYDVDAEINHMVCIIGYDDDYAVENFLPGHQPPAPGAWIVRNSWGTKWGNDGYFYLSYYDRTISNPESFVFDVSDVDNRTDSMIVLNYSYMQISSTFSIPMDTETPMACIYNVDEDEVLTNAGVLTAVQDTDAVISVYLLNEGATTPDDGRLLVQQTNHFDYSGYHRVKLNGNYLIPGGSRISIVVSMTYDDHGTVTAVMPINMGQNYEGLVSALGREPTVKESWSEASVEHGGSFVFEGGQWVDWADEIALMCEQESSYGDYAIDDPSLKLYLYPFDQMQEIHHLDEVVTDAEGNMVSVCEEDGFTVVR